MNTLPFVGPMPEWNGYIFSEVTGKEQPKSRFGWDDPALAALDAPVWVARGSMLAVAFSDMAFGSQVMIRPGTFCV